MLDALQTATRMCSRALMLISGVGIVLMTAFIGWQVFGRYVLNASPAWTEQAALVLMIWFVMFAAAAGVYEGFHIRIGVLADAAPPRLRVAFRVATLVVITLCAVALVVWGSALVVHTWSHVIPTLGLPRGVAYLPLPLSGALMALFALERLAEVAQGRERERREGSTP